MNIKLCVFDLAGTSVVDFGDVVAESFRKAFVNHGLGFSKEAINKHMGKSKPLAISLICEDHKVNLSQEKRDKIHDTFVSMMKDHYQENTKPIDGAFKVFNLLHMNGIKVACDTGFSKEITDVIMGKLGWITNGIVDAVCSSDEVENGRPHADMIFKLMKELNVIDSKQVCKVGDTPSDLAEGRSANCGMTVGVWEGSHSKEELQKHYYTHLIPNINHLIDIL